LEDAGKGGRLEKTAANRESGSSHTGIHAMAQAKQRHQKTAEKRTGSIGSVSPGMDENEEKNQGEETILASDDSKHKRHRFGYCGE
jgi:hypothetical protein